MYLNLSEGGGGQTVYIIGVHIIEIHLFSVLFRLLFFVQITHVVARVQIS